MTVWTSKGSTRIGCPSTSPASWTETAGGPPSRDCRGPKGTGPARRPSSTPLQGALELGIPWFTVYAFSTENWRRPHDEVRFLLNVIADNLLTRRRDDLHRMGVRIRFIGRRDWRVPRWVLRRMDEAVELTRPQPAHDPDRRLQLRGSGRDRRRRQAIARRRGRAGRRDRREKPFGRHLYAPDMPDPDLVIRTSGEFRLSNFLAVGAGLQRAGVHRRPVARLPPRAPGRGRPGVPGPGPAFRRHQGPPRREPADSDLGGR